MVYFIFDNLDVTERRIIFLLILPSGVLDLLARN